MRSTWLRGSVRASGTVLVSGALLLAACGSDGSGEGGSVDDDAAESSAAPADPSSSSESEPSASPEEVDVEETQDLLDAAIEEGGLVIAMPTAAEAYQSVWDAWDERYPDITVHTISIGSTQMAGQIIQEAQANAMTIDVAMSGPDTISSVWDRGLAASEDWQSLNPEIDASKVMYDGHFLRTADQMFGWVYNTDLLEPDEVPQSWEELLEPQWHGQRLSIIAGGDLGLAAVVTTGAWDEEDVHQYSRDLVGQEPAVEARGAAIVNAVATGQLPLGNFPLTVVPQMLKDGAPIAVAPVSPLAVMPFGVLVTKDAPNPNAARLFVSWLASPEGAAALDAGGRGLATDCDASALGRVACDAGIEMVMVEGDEDMATFERVREITHQVLLDADVVPEDDE